jgi:uncharacterized protein YjiS (DUF1127 family)
LQYGWAAMALVQTTPDHVVRLPQSPRLPAALRRLVWLIAKTCAYFGSAASHGRNRLARWSKRRRAGARLTMAERGRQRRALAQLSDRELRDIGLTRYDVEFLLRKSSWP